MHLMSMSSTCTLNYVMPSVQVCFPCIFVIYVVTSTSMQTRLRDVAFLQVLFCCYFDAMYPCCYSEIHDYFEILHEGCFEHMVMLYPSMPLFAIMECPRMSQSCSTFAIKCSWQNVNMLFNFAKVFVVDPYML